MVHRMEQVNLAYTSVALNLPGTSSYISIPCCRMEEERVVISMTGQLFEVEFPHNLSSQTAPWYLVYDTISIRYEVERRELLTLPNDTTLGFKKDKGDLLKLPSPSAHMHQYFLGTSPLLPLQAHPCPKTFALVFSLPAVSFLPIVTWLGLSPVKLSSSFMKPFWPVDPSLCTITLYLINLY